MSAAQGNRARLAASVALGVAGGLAGLGAAYFGSGRHRTLGATEQEAASALPGDDLVPDATLTTTRAISIDAPPDYVWPWVAQLGQQRGGFYTYTAVENLAGCQIRNADTIVAAWQHPAVGDPFHLHPDVRLEVAAVHEGEALVVRWQAGPDGQPAFDFSWAFVVQPAPAGRSRLLIRERYRPQNRGAATSITTFEPVSTVMTAGTLRGIRQRAEQLFTSGV